MHEFEPKDSFPSDLLRACSLLSTFLELSLLLVTVEDVCGLAPDTAAYPVWGSGTGRIQGLSTGSQDRSRSMELGLV